jgi:hypothetical protein
MTPANRAFLDGWKRVTAEAYDGVPLPPPTPRLPRGTTVKRATLIGANAAHSFVLAGPKSATFGEYCEPGYNPNGGSK